MWKKQQILDYVNSLDEDKYYSLHFNRDGCCFTSMQNQSNKNDTNIIIPFFKDDDDMDIPTGEAVCYPIEIVYTNEGWLLKDFHIYDMSKYSENEQEELRSLQSNGVNVEDIHFHPYSKFSFDGSTMTKNKLCK